MSRRLLTLSAAALVAASLVSPSHAGWSADPVQVFATPNACAQVAVHEDAGFGAIVVWHESGAPLRAAHLLPTGELDPAWPAFVDIATSGAERTALALVGDGAGGVFATWMQGATVYAQHVLADGTVHAGWPAGGRALRTLLGGYYRADIEPDGDGGFWMAWLQQRVIQVGSEFVELPTFMLDRRGPDGLVRSGWPAGGRTIGIDAETTELVAGCSIGPAPDGGVWAAWCMTVLFDPGGINRQYPGQSRVVRLDANGDPAPGWDARGVALGSYPGTSIATALQYGWWSLPDAVQIAVTSDGGDGAFVTRSQSVGVHPSYNDYVLEPRLHRVDGLGAAVGAWPASGLAVLSDGIFGAPGFPEMSSQVHAAGDGGAYVTTFLSATDVPLTLYFVRVAPDLSQAMAYAVQPAGLEVGRAGDGGFLLASFHPDGPAHFWDSNAFVACHRSNGPYFIEWHDQPVVPWYGDVGVAGLRDGGAILAWSQYHERFGVFAVRLNAAGLVTGVSPPAAPAAAHLALRYVPGAGVRASAAFGSRGEARLVLADVTGRAVARETFAAGEAAREWTLAGTAALAPGLYFARVERGAEVRTARVVVAR